MSRFYKIALGVLVLLIIGLTYLETNTPQPLNWFPTYSKQDKVPLGTYILFETWQDLNKNNFGEVDIPPFEYLNEPQTDTVQKSTYFFINNSVNFDDTELNTLLKWVAKGNDVFIASNNFSKNLLDTLQLNIKPYQLQLDSNLDYEPKTEVSLVNPNLGRDTFSIPHEFHSFYFSKIDTINSTVLGTMATSSSKKNKNNINFIETTFGDGNIFMHTTPEAFSNYFILQNKNYKYIENVLGYIKPKNKILWDNYYKTGKANPQSLLYVLMQNKSLRWAYYLCILAVILFIYFEGKRKQRAIPVVTPPKNQSYLYTQTIAELYLENKEVKSLTEKKIKHFLEYIQQQYKLTIDQNNNQFYTILAEKSGNKVETVKKLFQQLENAKKNAAASKVFMNLNTAIHQFKNNPDGK
ncbi:DUF4350 domain-containing protein [Zunongwangia sp.]|uniref:DUF4350 domain-containing protein n=1 Tax=Zunongwangia sp. TaxID=1965325 RepID=UPI003AA7CB8E